jgi:hypothetical protein
MEKTLQGLNGKGMYAAKLTYNKKKNNIKVITQDGYKRILPDDFIIDEKQTLNMLHIYNNDNPVKPVKPVKSNSRVLTPSEELIYHRLMKKLDGNSEVRRDLQDALQRGIISVITNNKQFNDDNHFKNYLGAFIKAKKLKVIQEFDLNEVMTLETAGGNMAMTEDMQIPELNEDLIDVIRINDSDNQLQDDIELKMVFKKSYDETSGYKRESYDDADDYLSEYRFTSQPKKELKKYILDNLKTAEQKKIFTLSHDLEYTVREIADIRKKSKSEIDRIIQKINAQILKLNPADIIGKWYSGTGASKSDIWAVWPESLPEITVKNYVHISDPVKREKKHSLFQTQSARIKEKNSELIDASRDVPLTGTPLQPIDYGRLDRSLKGFKGIKKVLKDEHYGVSASMSCLSSNWIQYGVTSLDSVAYPAHVDNI